MAVIDRNSFCAADAAVGGEADFQALCWYAEDVKAEDDDEDADDNEEYVMHVFGVRADGRAATLKITDFSPYFFVKVPDVLAGCSTKSAMFVKAMRDRCRGAKRADLVHRKDFLGFTNEKIAAFVQLSFSTLRRMRWCAKSLENSCDQFVAGTTVRRFDVYENNIDPVLRFMHCRNIRPVGWIKPKFARSCKFDIISPSADDQVRGMAPVLIASFDVECNSSHGDFPLAKKDLHKLAVDIVSLYDAHLKNAFPLPYDLQFAVTACVLEAFGAEWGSGSGFERIETARETIRSGINTVHVKRGSSVDAAFLQSTTFKIFDDLLMLLRAGGKVAEVVRLLNLAFGSRIKVEGDEIIQIATVFHVYGQTDVCHRHVLVLGTCDDIPDVELQRCATERELLLGWTDLMARMDPDVLIGYNICGFDMAYMYHRAEELGCVRDFCRLGRLPGRVCDLKEQKLASSALGENVLNYIDVHGRVIIDLMKVVQRDHKLDSYKLDNVASFFLKLNKHDVSPHDIFRLQRGGASDRAVIAKYCVQDSELCNRLFMRLEVLANNVGMANVCHVPLSYIFFRGQGVKIHSLIARQCMEDGFLIPAKQRFSEASESDASYEGAIVLNPCEGVYLDDPVSVLDYASLYPSSMISENLSHDTIVLDQKYGNLPGVEYLDICYDTARPEETTCRFAQNKKGVLPRILMQLVQERKKARRRMETDASLDDFQRAVLDGLQLAYKVTANSLYGQMGAQTSPVYLKHLAACTTATGRDLILRAKTFLETQHGARVVYGDTDSIFVIFPSEEASGSMEDRLADSIARAQKASGEFKKLLKPPHDLEYEKTFWPFVLFSKKRYVGNLYEHDVKKYKQKSMGIVLKRRDNANVVKLIYGGVIDIILNQRDVSTSVNFLKNSLDDLVEGRSDISDLIITKTLRSGYKDPERIAHNVLAQRIAERDPGNKPRCNDRIPYVYVLPPPGSGKNVLQGNRIEDPKYIAQHKLRIDYGFYITNQIMKPVCQLYGLLADSIGVDVEKLRSAAAAKHPTDPAKQNQTFRDACEKQAEALLFGPVLKRLERRKDNQRSMMDYFKGIGKSARTGPSARAPVP